MTLLQMLLEVIHGATRPSAILLDEQAWTELSKEFEKSFTWRPRRGYTHEDDRTGTLDGVPLVCVESPLRGVWVVSPDLARPEQPVMTQLRAW